MVEVRQVDGDELYGSLRKYIGGRRYQAVIINTDYSRRIIQLNRCNIHSEVEYDGKVLTFIRWIDDVMFDRQELNVDAIRSVDGILFP